MAWAFSGWRLWLLFAAALLLVYGPALRGDFLWDDRPGHVTRPELQSGDGLRRIWFELGATQQYYPVLHTAFWVEHRLWGDATAGYHVINVLLHVTVAWLFAGLLRRLALPGATLAGWLFALHPVCVESVAWISEQKNTLSAAFYLAAALAYLKFDDGGRRRDYVVATLLFGLALLTKTVTATLPAALLVVAWWRRGNLAWRRDVQPLLPWFALSVGMGLLTAWFERELIGAHGAEFVRSVAERALLPSRVVLFYLGKLIWPANLTFVYPRWSLGAGDAIWFGGVASVVIALVMAWRWRLRARGPLAALLLFGGTLFPVLGFFDVYPFRYSFVADHFQYLASLSWFAGFGFALAGVFRRPRQLAAAGTLVAAALGLAAWSQSGFYRDPFALYGATLARNPDCWMAHNNLAEALAAAGRPAEAIPHLEAALRLKPDSAEAENNLGDDLRQVNRAAEAIPHLRRALELQPKYPEAHNNLGVAFMALNRVAEGKAEFETALGLKPDFALARFNLGLACANSGDVASAARHFAAAVALRPDYAEAELNWAIALLLLRDLTAATPHFERALQLQPDSTDAHQAFARALGQGGQWDRAIAEYRAALEINPRLAAAQMNLALALRQIGRNEEAASHYAEAVRLGARP